MMANMGERRSGRTGRTAQVRRLALSLVILVLGISTSVATAQRVGQTATEGRLSTELALRAGAIGESLERYGSLVAGASAYFSRVEHDPAGVTDQDLRTYLEAVGGIQRYPDLGRGLVYIARVERQEVQNYVTRRRASMPTFEVDGRSSQIYQAIVWAQSSDSGHHGIHADAEPNRSTALDESLERHQVLMTAPVLLPGTQEPGVHIFGPVTSADGNQPLGWIGTALSIEDLVVLDGDSHAPWHLGITDNGVPVFGDEPIEVSLARQLSLPVIGRDWRLNAYTTQSTTDAPILVAGLALTCLALLLTLRADRLGTRLRSSAMQAERARDRYAGFVETAFAHVDVGIIACDRDGRITIINDAARRILAGHVPAGLPEEWEQGLSAGRPGAKPFPLKRMPLFRALHGEDVDDEEVVFSLPDGDRTLLVSAHPLLDPSDGTGDGAVAAINDITDRKAAESAMTRLAMEDHLTGLANRRRLSLELESALRMAASGGPAITLLLMDLDRFKQVNDTIGHHRGDQMLIDVAARLADLAHDGDVPARIGGDEFVLLCPHQSSMAEASRLAHRVVATLTPALALKDGLEVGTGVSIGVVRPAKDSTVDDVLRFADLAMYEAKCDEGTSVRLYRSDMDQRASGLIQREAALRRAPADGSLRLAFQPVIDARTGQTVAAEGLVRWDGWASS